MRHCYNSVAALRFSKNAGRLFSAHLPQGFDLLIGAQILCEMKSNLIFLTAFAMFLGACSTSLPYSKNVRLSHLLLEEDIKWYQANLTDKIFVATDFRHREEILSRRAFGNEKADYGELYQEKAKGLQFNVNLSEHLKNTIQMYDGKTDLAKSKEIYLFCSPLLKTKERHIYVMQVFTAYTLRDGEEEIRFVERYFKKYRIRNGNAIFLERIQSDNDWFNP